MENQTEQTTWVLSSIRIDRISYGATIEMLEMLKIKECGLQIPACYFKLSILQDRKSKINNLPK